MELSYTTKTTHEESPFEIFVITICSWVGFKVVNLVQFYISMDQESKMLIRIYCSLREVDHPNFINKEKLAQKPS